ncbi:MAG: class 1 fructose-bisphosphatase [Epsilonproteobacteria bacterium]|nr:class 1 fructose-bisphosphatase [Campylobacterota bacterium]NPA57247.1 class 1 fructose-bisphosphatase [Campylobacterota bacterium]
MEEIFEAILRGARRVYGAINQGELGYCDTNNCSGEQQLRLDLISDQIWLEELQTLPSVQMVASEEREEPVETGRGEYLVAYDPLDGSSLVDVDLSVGSIFGIYRESFQGANLVGSAYVVYGPRIEVVTALQGEVKRSIVRHDGGLIPLDPPRLKERGKLNAPGGTQKGWYPHHRELIDSLFSEGYRLRYSGGMVPDLHQILVKGGGLFSYPGTEDKPNGKLRKLFEVFPFAFIYEEAGGEAIDDRGRRLLDLPCQGIHETTPCFFGSSYEIGRVREFYNVPRAE